MTDKEAPLVEGTVGDAKIIGRTAPATSSAGQSWPDVSTHAAADAQALERSISFPEGNLTIAQKQAILRGESIDQEVK
jgi:hypothetical protein